MSMKKTIAVAAVSGLLTLGANVSVAADKASADKACAAAETARKDASSVGGEWRDTGKIIKKAAAAAKKGDFAGAAKLCAKAEQQGKMGKAQALAQKVVPTPNYMK